MKKYNARILIEDGEVLCCSTMCDADGGCVDYYKCKPVQISVQEVSDNDQETGASCVAS